VDIRNQSQRDHVDSIADPAGCSAERNFKRACAGDIILQRQRTCCRAIINVLAHVADTSPDALHPQLCHRLQVRALQRPQHPTQHSLARLPRRPIPYQRALRRPTVREARLEARPHQDVAQQDERPYQVPA